MLSSLKREIVISNTVNNIRHKTLPAAPLATARSLQTLAIDVSQHTHTA